MNFLLRGKQLIRTASHPIFRFETGVNNLKFIVPKTYFDYDISKTIPVVEIDMPTDLNNTRGFYYTNWSFDSTPYNDDYLSFTIPINSQLTQFPGTVYIWVMFVEIEDDTVVKTDTITSGSATYNSAKVVLKSYKSSFVVEDSGSSDSATEKDFEEVWYHVTVDSLKDTIDKLIDIDIDDTDTDTVNIEIDDED